ncbi:MAG: hypothetical protein KJN64_04045 [Ignavibacteria bacterium]|nr:hypothetical protein [Ignavibacteria bacterium]MBT8390374.1 hypothetical protein [Ignavibacteria bacterium]NNJ53366.1 hypothetical protein [Ignavibacteriaceae bacterium]NNL21619.1 hypothetical protein [Ignavibacteriaceae bacterium]
MKASFLSFLSFILILFFLFALTGCNKKYEEQTVPQNVPDTTAVETTKHFLFVGKWYGKAGVYKYDLNTKKHETVWWHPRENVKLLISKTEVNPAFFFTLRKTGFQGGFPYFEKVKIYRISKDFSKTEFIYSIKDGMQITARWNNDENFEVVFTEIDKTDPIYINRHIKTFDGYGKLINDEIETFNLVADGFPELLPERNPTVSASGRYGISVVGDSVYLKTADGDSLKFIIDVNHYLKKIEWSIDEQFVFISTLDLENESLKTQKPETSELFVYSIVKDSVVASWSGAGIKNFFTLDSLLVFDNGFGRNSSIFIYNYLNEELFKKFNIKGECGLFYIPEL